MNDKVIPPPRLLLGASLLFWGAMTDRPFIGLIMALLIESPNWLPFRWNFSNKASSIAWRVSFLVTVLTGVLIWLDGDRYTAISKLITWFPALLLPTQLVQLFGFSKSIEIRSLSFVSGLSRNHKISHATTLPPTSFNFGNAYFIIILIAASLGYHAQHFIFYPFLAILTSWLIFYRLKRRIPALIIILLVATTSGIIGQIGMSKLYHWITNRDTVWATLYDKSPTINKTSIGSLGEIKQSPEIFWRIITHSNTPPPNLIRLATYNRYRGVNWRSILPEFENEKESFRDLTTINIAEDKPIYLLRESINRSELEINLPTFEIRGRSGSEKPLPLPGNASTLKDFELDAIDINPHGSVRVFPKRSVIHGSVRWNDPSTPDAPPSQMDLEIDPSEIDGINLVANQLGLNNLPTTAAKITRIKHFFNTQFEYSRYLTIPAARAARARPTPIETFLTTSKRGHCEYFATSATLLLRAAGVPARYSVGFAVMEKNKSNEWFIRGTHGHAWTRVWDSENKRWFDFDPTPPSWLSFETIGPTSKTQWLADAFLCFREDFFIWRNKPTNRLGASIAMWSVAFAVCFFLGRRLWKSKVILSSQKNHPSYGNGNHIRTSLHDLEPIASKILSPRNPSETLPNWLSQLTHHGIPAETLDEALDIHQRLRFDPSPQPKELTERLSNITAKLRQIIPKKRSKPVR